MSPASLCRSFFGGFTDGVKECVACSSTLINSLLLGVVYLFGIGATAAAAKLFGIRFIEHGERRSRDSYCIEREQRPMLAEEHYRQF